VLDLSEANCRQVHRRARQRVSGQRRFVASTEARRLIVERFLTAARNGDLAGLEQVLATDVVAWADGGGKVSAALRPVSGAVKVGRYVAGIAAKFGDVDVRMTYAEVNGEAALLASLDDRLLAVFVIETDGDRIHGLRSILNPDKLAYLVGQLARRLGLSQSGDLSRS
jgi:RNA polymerase sigma-70 factor (ECF subfamily)